jgi:hypothetical protein
VTRNLPRDALLLLGLVAGIAQAAGVIPASHDAWYYWQADLDALYPIRAWDPTLSGYIYPPPMAQLLEPFRWLPWPVVQVAVTTGLVAALWYCAGTWAWLFIGLGVLRAAFPVLPEELGIVAGYALNGNVQLGIAAVTVAGLRHPGLWAFPLLTKIGPGIGLLWFLFRREWWPLLVGIATTAVICGVSLVLAPTLWTEWLVFVLVNRDAPSPLPLVPVALPIRLLMSTLLLAWAAPRGHRWAVPLAAGWAIPALYEGTYLGVWVAAIRLVQQDHRDLPVAEVLVTRPAGPAVLRREHGGAGSQAGQPEHP